MGLRGLLVVAVLTVHVPDTFNWRLPIIEFPVGTTAVFTFFVLSGFLITRILLQSKSTGQRIGSFYARRIARIFPCYFACIAVTWAFSGPLFFLLPPGSSMLHPGRWLLHAATFTTNFYPSADDPLGHLWSLGIEEQFYLLWPIALWQLPKRYLISGAWFIIAVYGASDLVAGSMVADRKWPELATFWLQERMFRPIPILAGSLIALHEGWWRAERHRSLEGAAWLCGGAALCSLILPCDTLNTASLSMFFEQAFAVGLVLFALGVEGGQSIAAKFLSSKPLARLAEISYGLYVWHIIVYYVVGFYSLSAIRTSNGLAFIVSITVAYASYHLMEKPIINWARKLSADRATLKA